VLVYMLHLTIATKQPAMTAQTIANRLGELKPGRALDLSPVVDLIIAVARTQFAAILGNVMIALPTAIGVSLLLAQLRGAPIIDIGKASHLLADLDPLSWLPLHAAIAGVFLFLSGVLTGYFDNWATYARVGSRVERLRWLRAVAGPARAQRVAAYVEAHMGGLMGNFLFGCMLGSAGTLGVILGLPIDIRHIAFAAANLGYALVAFDFTLPWITVAWAALGVGLTGAINLTVSFSLALWMALRARGVVFTQTRALLAALWQRVRREPASLFVVGRAAEADSTSAS
jgi:site-specific recombinase